MLCARDTAVLRHSSTAVFLSAGSDSAAQPPWRDRAGGVRWQVLTPVHLLHARMCLTRELGCSCIVKAHIGCASSPGSRARLRHEKLALTEVGW